MTDATNTNDIDEELGDAEGGEELEGGSKKSGGKKKLLMIVLPVLLLGGGAGVFFSGLADSLLGKEKNVEVASDHGAEPAEGNGGDAGHGNAHSTSYYELPQMLVNLSSSGRRTNYLKIVVSLELTSEADKALLESALPRIVDNFQIYLRELRVEDLRGSAGLYRLREELLFRVNAAVSPARVTDVLFKEMLIQ
ncbi:MAG: flagellar basal body-associated FliL family protein [Alphaproteobacteria bacterium]|nr:flagellar basal body-associated FliL family protein [Alphaproteobacteria bacterium]